MPNNIPELERLRGLNEISEEERRQFLLDNDDKLKKYARDRKAYNRHAEIIYNNQKFKDAFGEDEFNKTAAMGKRGYDYRNALFKHKTIDDAWNKYYSPIAPDGKRDNRRGLGADWERMQELSDDGRLELMQSDWKDRDTFAREELGKWGTTPEAVKEAGEKYDKLPGWLKFVSNLSSTGSMAKTAINAQIEKHSENNKKILDDIYQKDGERKAELLEDEYMSTYLNDSRSDNEIVDAFTSAIVPNSYVDERGVSNPGIPEYARNFKVNMMGMKDVTTDEMKDFSVDDMRKVLAKKEVYEKYMSPYLASTLLNNEAKKYIEDHQGFNKKASAFINDVLIASMSYTADKVNGLRNIGWSIAGSESDVYIDDRGEVVDPKKHVIKQTEDNTLYYTDDKGENHNVQLSTIPRTTLYQAGRNADGSEDTSILNPVFWTKAEQFGTLSRDEQKQYEALQGSPYKLSDITEENSFWWETFKMGSFAIADAAMECAPYGIGKVGKILSTASKVGRAGRALGKGMAWAGRSLSQETKVGSTIQGLLGAEGIGYAYSRGAYQETFAKNMADLEETTLIASNNEIRDRYNTDAEYKSTIDALVEAELPGLRQAYKDAGEKVDDASLRKVVLDAIMDRESKNRLEERKNSPEYLEAVERAMVSAGKAANAVFFPEAVKYGLVNTFGHRQFLYRNPTGLGRSISPELNNIGERTVEGRQRLVSTPKAPKTFKQKVKAIGSTAFKQAWGGAWTNGTDDMMVDAAEQINEDSYSRYLDAYANGEPYADTYGFIDGYYSYINGLGRSLGQSSTWNAAGIGAAGSTFSATPHFANIARLLSKEGREQYVNAFQRRNKYDENGILVRDENGKIVTEDISLKENWRDRAAYLIQNGVLNNYYGIKQSDRDLQEHVDYINNILDETDDFNAISELIKAGDVYDSADNVRDQKTARFIHALKTIQVLNSLGNSPRDPAIKSSVVAKARELIDRASQINSEEYSNFTPEERYNMISQYYAHNNSTPMNEADYQSILNNISKNANRLIEASQIVEDTQKEIQRIEQKRGPIDPRVRDRLVLEKALQGHFSDRIEQMRNEIGDNSSAVPNNTTGAAYIASLGGKKGASSLLKIYERQLNELNEEITANTQEEVRLQDEYDATVQKVKNAPNDNARYQAEQELAGLQVRIQNNQQNGKYLRDLADITDTKRQAVSDGLQAEEETKLLTADEIFNLDPVSRARMLNPTNLSLYSKKQQASIRALIKKLVNKDPDALSKIQDIANLTQRMATSEDAYARMLQNPEAAAFSLDEAERITADAAYNMINLRNAELVADMAKKFATEIRKHPAYSKELLSESVFRLLSRHSDAILGYIESENMLPRFATELNKAKEWRDVVDDLSAVVSNMEESDAWKETLNKDISAIIDLASNRDEIISSIENAIDSSDDAQFANTLDRVLKGMESLGYQRDATTIENRKQRKQREEAEAQSKQKAEKVKQKADEDAKAAAAEAQARAQEVANAQQAQAVNADGSNLQNPWEVTPIDQGEGTAEQKGELSETIDLNEPIVTKPSYHSSMKSQLGDKKSNWDYYTESEKETRDTPDGKVILGSAMQKALQPAINYAIDAGILDASHKIADTTASMENSTKVREAVKVLKDLGIETPQQLIEFVEKNEGKNLEGNKKEAPVVNNSVGEQLIIDNGDSVQGKSATIDEQMSETSEGKEAHSSDENIDYAAQNGIGEHVIETSATSLSGNAMSEWKPEPLKKGVLEHKQGAKPDDSMSKYYVWMEAAGIKLQNIIDQELGQILRQNPHAKVKFMVVRPENNATKDGNMKTHLMLVLDYDNKINKGITHIHNEENGGVIESQGKQYLVIGTAGYSSRNADKQALYDILFSNNPKSSNGLGLVKRGTGEFWRNNPSERFYVHPTLETEVVPMSLIPGYIVKQLENDSNSEFRSVKELLVDPARNPLGLEMNDLGFGIQELTKFMVVGASLDRVMVPRNVDRNSGNAFVLIPAGNGKMVPSYLKPLFYNEMNDGALKDRVIDLLNGLTAPDYATRLQAVENLSRIFHFDKDGNTILLMKSKPVLSLVRDGKPFKTFTLDSNFDRQAFMEAFSEMNPRVNITKSVLQSNVLLQQYDEAGALQTDIAQLATAGSSYSIYGLDAQGKMIQPETVDNAIPRTGRNSDFRNNDRTQVVFKHQYYNYDVNEGRYYLNGIPVMDETLVRHLDYNRRIIEAGLSSIESKGVWSTYILGNKEHPEAVRVHRNTKEVQEIPDAEAVQIIERVEKEQQDKERAEAARQAMKPNKTEDVELGTEEQGLVVDDETGEMVTPDELRQRQVERSAQLEEKGKKGGEGETPAEQSSSQSDKLHRSGAELSNSTSAATQNFTDLIKSKAFKPFMRRFRSIIQQKWSDAPSKVAELKRFLKDKNIEVDVIGTSETDINVWLDTIQNCR